MSFSRGLNRLLVAVYWCLFFGLLCSVLASLAVRDADWTRRDHRMILYALAGGLVLQAAAFAFIFTPIVMQLKSPQRASRKFSEIAIWTEVCVVFPITLLVALILWLSAHTESTIKTILHN